MKKRYLQIAAAVIPVLLAVVLIAGRIIPRSFESLLPEDFAPESAHVSNFFDWGEGRYLSGEEQQILWEHLNGLEYRYAGRLPGGVMKGIAYHLSFWQLEDSADYVYVFITKELGVMYMDDKEYDMIGDTKPLLEFLDGLN